MFTFPKKHAVTRKDGQSPEDKKVTEMLTRLFVGLEESLIHLTEKFVCLNFSALFFFFFV